MATNNEIIIQVKNVTKAYGNKEAVKNASLVIKRGEFYHNRGSFLIQWHFHHSFLQLSLLSGSGAYSAQRVHYQSFRVPL